MQASANVFFFWGGTEGGFARIEGEGEGDGGGGARAALALSFSLSSPASERKEQEQEQQKGLPQRRQRNRPRGAFCRVRRLRATTEVVEQQQSGGEEH